MAVLTATVTDNAGHRDSSGNSRTVGIRIDQDTGQTDRNTRQNITAAGGDPAGPTDSATAAGGSAPTFTRTVTDNAGMGDAFSRQDIADQPTDSAGMRDLTSVPPPPVAPPTPPPPDPGAEIVPTLVSLPRLIVQMAIGGTTPKNPAVGGFVLGVSQLGVGTLGALAWVDVTTDVLSVGTTPSPSGVTDTASPGSATIVIDNFTGAYDLENPASVGIPGTKFGAFIDGSAIGTSGWAAGAAEWLALTGIPLSAGRWYAGTNYVIGATLTEMITAGVRIVIDFAPPYNPVSATDRSSINAMLSALKAAGADVRVSLWHEPFLGGLSAAQYVAMIQYYGPTVRQHYPLWSVFSENDTVEANGYYPGDGTIDGIAADCYSTSTTNLDNCALMADAHGLPLGLWECNAANDLGIDPSPVNGATNAQGLAFFDAVKAKFLARLAAGKLNGDILVFSATSVNTGTQNFLGDAFSQAGGFEGGIANWVAGTGTTAAASSAQAHSGTSSLLLTCTTAGTIAASHCLTANISTQGMPVNPGDTVAFSAWFLPGTTARFAQPGVLFYNSAGTFLSTAFAGAVTETVGVWKFMSGTAVAPATAARVKFNPQVTSVALGEQHFIDDPQMSVLPAVTDHTAPVQYPWDYRIPGIAAIQAALDGTSASSQATQYVIDVGQHVRVRAEWNGVAYGLFYGYIDDITPDYGYEPTVAFSCTDGLAQLGRAKVLEITPGVGDGDRTDQRLDRILTEADWPVTMRALEKGLATCQADTYGDSGLSLAQRTVDTELGEHFIDYGSGAYTFYNRTHVYTAARSTTVQALFTDSGTDIDMQGVTSTRARGELFNQAAITRQGDGAVEQFYEDAASRLKYGPQTFPRSAGTMLQTDSAAASLCRWIVARFRLPGTKIADLSIDATTQGMWDQILPLRRFDRVRVQRTYGTAHVVVDKQVLVETVAWSITNAPSWTATIATRPADDFKPFVLGSSRLGTGVLA